MKFCKVCDNMYYLSVSKSGDELSQYCRNCGDIEPSVSELCIFSSEVSTIEETKINRYTKLDPTLPRIDKIPCPNTSCQTKNGTPTEIILIRYDHTNMRYLYLCSTCDHVWKTDIKN